MKKILLPTMLAVALFANPANNGGAGGFQGAQGGAQDGAQASWGRKHLHRTWTYGPRYRLPSPAQARINLPFR